MSPSAFSPKPGVMMLGDVVHAHDEFAALSNIADVLHINKGTRESFLAQCKAGDFDHVKVISRTVESAQVTGLIDRDLIAALPPSIKFICHNGAGYDQIDAPACAARGIIVSNTPTAVDAATADMALFLMLGAMRRAWIAQSALRRGAWRGDAPLGHDLEGKTLGILGMGGIGSAVARRAVGFGLTVQYHNRKPVSEEKAAAAGNPRYVETLDELLRTSDVLSVHLPLTEKTRHTIGKRELGIMKTGVTIVNTARGAVLDEQALVDALADGDRVWSVGLDVFEGEPAVHPKLVADERVMLLPHIGTATLETQKKMEVLTIDNVASGVREHKLLTPVNA